MPAPFGCTERCRNTINAKSAALEQVCLLRPMISCGSLDLRVKPLQSPLKVPQLRCTNFWGFLLLWFTDSHSIEELYQGCCMQRGREQPAQAERVPTPRADGDESGRRAAPRKVRASLHNINLYNLPSCASIALLNAFCLAVLFHYSPSPLLSYKIFSVLATAQPIPTIWLCHRKQVQV